jgi:hypothetical protein
MFLAYWSWSKILSMVKAIGGCYAPDYIKCC